MTVPGGWGVGFGGWTVLDVAIVGGLTVGGLFIDGTMSSEYSVTSSNIKLGPDELPLFVITTECDANSMTEDWKRTFIYALSEPVACVIRVALPPSIDISATTFPPPPGRVT